MKLKLALAVMASMMIINCGETEDNPVVNDDPDSTEVVKTEVTEKDTTIIDPVTGDTTKVTIKDTVVTVEKKPEDKDTTGNTTKPDDKDDTTNNNNNNNTNPGDLDVSDSPAYEILDSDTNGTGEYATLVEDLDMVLIPSKERVFVLGATKIYSKNWSSDFMFSQDSSSEADAMPAHTVKFTKNFFMKKTEVACEEFMDIINDNMYELDEETQDAQVGVYSTLSFKGELLYKDAGSGQRQGLDFNQKNDELELVGSNSDEFVANDISWHGAVYFCNKLSKLHGLEEVYDYDNNWEPDYTKNGFRLPTEAEWEYACKAGSDTPFFWGGVEDVDRAKYYVATDYDIVGVNRDNDFELYDMIGNVREWVNDYYGPYTSASKIDPTGVSASEATEEGKHVVRGNGGADLTGIQLLSTYRGYMDGLDVRTGFRYVLPIK